MFVFLLLLQGNPSSSVTEKPEIRAQSLLQVLHPKVREESYIWAIGNAVWSNVNCIIIYFLGSYLCRYAFRKQRLTTYWEPVGQIIYTEASLQCTQRLYNLAKKDVERRNRQKRKDLLENLRKIHAAMYLAEKFNMLFAHCLVFEVLLGRNQLHQQSIYWYTASVFHSSPISLHAVEMPKDRWFPRREMGVYLWSKCCLLSLTRPCSQLFPWTFLAAAPQLPIPCVSNRSF